MILVTGGTGLLGAHLLFDLLQKEEKVKAIKRSNSSLNTIRNIFSFYTSEVNALLQKIEWIDAELGDYYSLENALKGVKRVYHCAATVSFHKKDKDIMMKTNVLGTRNLVNACLYQNIEKFIYVSSIAALGRALENEITTEKTPWKDSDKTSAYSISKHDGELEVWRAMAEGLSAVIINPSVIIGPGDWSKGSPQLYSLVNKGLKYYTTGINGYVYVRDVSRAMITLMESEIADERFIVNGEDLSYLELFNMIAKALKKPYPTVKVKLWMMEVAWRTSKVKSWLTSTPPLITKSTARSSMQEYTYSSKKLIDALDFKYTALQRGIQYTADCFPE